MYDDPLLLAFALRRMPGAAARAAPTLPSSTTATQHPAGPLPPRFRAPRPQLSPPEQAPIPGLFSVGKSASAVAIPRRITCASMLVRRLVHLDYLAAGDDLCVVGAGFGGITAALEAAAYGVRVTLVERRPNAVWLQQQCTSRIVDPTEYEWPHPWYQESRFPLERREQLPAPLLVAEPPLGLNVRYGADLTTVDRLARTALDQLHALRTTIDTTPGESFALRLDSEAQLLADPAPDGRHQVIMCRNGRPLGPVESFDVVIFANVIGEERTWALPDATQRDYERRREAGESVRYFRSLAYWHNDDVLDRVQELRALAPPADSVTAERPQLLISGAGDGGLQDFIYYTTRDYCSPRQLLERVGEPSPDLMAEALKLALQRERALFWRPVRPRRGFALEVPAYVHDYACDELEAFQTGMRGLARRWLDSGGVRERLEAEIDRRVDVLLVVNHHHFTGTAFPLNVFVALAISELIFCNPEHPRRGMLCGYEVRHVGESCGPSCATQVGEPCDQAHPVELCADTQPCCARHPKAVQEHQLIPDLVLLRHGIAWSFPAGTYAAIDHPMPFWPR